MNQAVKEIIRFVLADDNEGMTAALAPDSDLDPDNKQMNRELIQRHERILAKLDRDETLNQEDLVLVRDANEIHVNDTLDLNGHHKEALVLEGWLSSRMGSGRQNSEEGPAFDDDGRCLKCGSRVSFADVTDTAVLVGDEIVKRYPGDITNRNCVRCTHPKQYPEYEDYDGGSSSGANRHQSVQPGGDYNGR
jgi:hypothetical protein